MARGRRLGVPKSGRLSEGTPAVMSPSSGRLPPAHCRRSSTVIQLTKRAYPYRTTIYRRQTELSRIAIIGNAAGGKSTLAYQISVARGLPLVEVDRLLWREDWHLASSEVYNAQHSGAIAGDQWVIEGLGSQGSIPARLSRATEIVLIDLPLWVHFALAAERQIHWSDQNATPAGLGRKPPTMALFKTMWEVDQNWLPGIRELCREAEQTKKVTRLCSLKEIDAYSAQVVKSAAIGIN
jgi:adenylate kinase family enzyme